MSVNAVSPAEEAVRGRLLSGFRAKVVEGRPNVIHATQFQGVLAENRLHFGHPIVDRIMLLCHIDETMDPAKPIDHSRARGVSCADSAPGCAAAAAAACT